LAAAEGAITLLPFKAKLRLMPRALQVVFLGNGRSGKTSMLRTLAKEPLQLDQQSTRGVTVDEFADDLRPGWGGKWRRGFDLELSFWDFAGQLEYSAAHDFFLSTRQAIYVAVYSVLDDNESITQQLLYWLSVIPEPTSSHVRLIIVGTKIDLILSSELQAVLQSKRSVIHHVVEAKGLVHKMQPSDILFVSALQKFDAPELNMTWATCRRALKDRIYEHCANIFSDDDPQQRQLLMYPKKCKEMSALATKLLKELKKKHPLPCCKLNHEDAVKVLGSILGEKDKDKRKNYFKTELVIMALEILNDLGIIVIYGHNGSLRASVDSSSVASICLEPQFLPGIMSLLVDPQTCLPSVTTVDALIDLMERNPEISLISSKSPRELKDQLLQLLESVGIVRRYGSSQKILVPLVLRGRPVSWSQIIRGRSSAVLLGQRLCASSTASVSAASFMRVMLDKCSAAERMWGCAFAYEVEGSSAEAAGSCIFVRLKEDRRSVDVVAVMDESEGSDVVAQREVDDIARLLDKDFSGLSERMQLCPMCCSADVFVRAGAVHAFHMQEVDAGGALQCSRYHDVTASDVTCGKLTKLDLNALPLVYPGRLHELQLPWKRVASGGIMNSHADAHSLQPSDETHALNVVLDSLSFQAPASQDVHPVPDARNISDRTEVVANANSDADAASSHIASAAVAAALDAPFMFHDGTFTDVSFFVLTGQVAAGDVIAADHLPEFMRQLSMCASQDCSCDITLSSGLRKTLRFSYTVGQFISSSFFNTPISCIFPADIGDRAQHPQAPRLPRFCAHDNVLVLFGPVQRGTKYLVFPGSSINLQLCRLTPTLCQTDLTAACCWSELQVLSFSCRMQCKNDAR